MDKDDATGGPQERRAQDPQGDSKIRDTVNQIWLAGLGALSRAQEEGGKLFESLAREGAEIQRKTQASAGEKMAQAGSRMAGLAEDLTQRASGQWDRVETRIEQGLGQTLDRMGLASARDLAALQARVDTLERTVALLTERQLGDPPAP